MIVSRSPYSFLFIWLLFATASRVWSQDFSEIYNPPGSNCLDAAETADGGFVMTGSAGSASELFLQRVDAAGQVVWTKHQSFSGARGIAVCRAASGGGFAVLCENFSDAGTLRNAVLRVDDAGNTLWVKLLENPSLPNGFQDLVATSDGGFAVAGYGRDVAPTADFFTRLLKLDASGTLLWSQTVNTGPATKELASRLLELPGGNLVVGGEFQPEATGPDAGDFFLAGFDALGTALWQHAYPHAGAQRLYDMTHSPDGSIVLMGQTLQTDPTRLTLLKADENGSERWFKQLMPILFGVQPNSVFKTLRRVCADSTGNLFVAFTATDWSAASSIWSLAKFTPAGAYISTHTSGSANEINVLLTSTDGRFAVGGQSGGAQAFLAKSNWGFNLNTLSGVLFWDKNADCAPQGTEPVPPEFVIEAEDQNGGKSYGSVGPDGTYYVEIGTGTYTVLAKPVAGTEDFWVLCDTPVVSSTGMGQTIATPPLAVQSTLDCPYLSVELGSGPIRRCTTAVYTVQYCNYGTATAADAFVDLRMDALQTYVSSSIPLGSQNGNTYTFPLGDVAVGQCGTFSAKFLLSCDAENGQTLCAEAHIFPDSVCTPQNAAWDGSDLVVEAVCNGNDAEFRIINQGTAMTGLTEYVIIEDQIMCLQGQIQLAAGADTVIVKPDPGGDSYYLRVAQRPGHPGLGKPSAVLDMCNGKSGPSLAMQLPLNQEDPFLAVYCNEVTGSYDPNDKTGFPQGWRVEHYIDEGQEIEYMIRFQNTGTDTAFFVMIADTLPAQLDPATVRPGASSHPYHYEVFGTGALRFYFDNILLPDSFENEAASHGYVRFRVSQVPGLPDETVIENKAAIFFDYNAPVITNTYYHTVGHPRTIFAPEAPGAAFGLQITPNPGTEYADFRVEPSAAGGFRLWLRNSMGQLVRTEQFEGNTYRFQRNGLAPGLYYFRLENDEGKAVSGKLILH